MATVYLLTPMMLHYEHKEIVKARSARLKTKTLNDVSEMIQVRERYVHNEFVLAHKKDHEFLTLVSEKVSGYKRKVQQVLEDSVALKKQEKQGIWN